MAEGAHWFYDLTAPARCATRWPNSRAAGSSSTSTRRTNARWRRLKSRSCCDDFLAGKGVLRQERDHLHLSDRPAARAGTGGELDGAGVRAPRHQVARISSTPSRSTRRPRRSPPRRATTLPYDLLITIPPHRGQQVITDSGLGKAGWVPTNRKTLLRDGSEQRLRGRRHHQHPDFEGRLDGAFRGRHGGRQPGVADARKIAGRATTTARCSASSRPALNTGTYVWFNYTTPPNPGPPSQMVHWFKLAYNRLYWLSARGLL